MERGQAATTGAEASRPASSSGAADIAQARARSVIDDWKEAALRVHAEMGHQGVDLYGSEAVLRTALDGVGAALMECRTGGRSELSLTGHSVPALPDLSGIVPDITSAQLNDMNLQAWPAGVHLLEHLEHLDLNANFISALPTEIEQMRALQILNLEGNRLRALPEGIGRLTALECLYLAHNPPLQRLPESIGDLSRLRLLEVHGCDLRALPESLGRLQALQLLSIQQNENLRALPSSFDDLPSQCEISLDWAPLADAEEDRLLVLAQAGRLHVEDAQSPHASPAASGDQELGLAEAVSRWRARLTEAPSTSDAAPLSRMDWSAFAAEDNAQGFATWLERLSRKTEFEYLAREVSEVMLRMEQSPELRGRCFALAVDALDACHDRVIVGANNMQAALLVDTVNAGNRPPAELLDLSRRLFNREALTTFAREHALRSGIEHEELEVQLALEVALRHRLALPPGARTMNYGRFARDSGRVSEQVVDMAFQRVMRMHQDSGPEGLPAFLAGLSGFSGWVDHLRSEDPESFERIDSDAEMAAAGSAREGNGAYLAAFAEATRVRNARLVELVSLMTSRTLTRQDFEATTRATRWRDRVPREIALPPSFEPFAAEQEIARAMTAHDQAWEIWLAIREMAGARGAHVQRRDPG